MLLTFSVVEKYFPQNHTAERIEFYVLATENNHRLVPNEQLHAIRIGECVNLCDGQCLCLGILILVRPGNFIDDNDAVIGDDQISIIESDACDGGYVTMQNRGPITRVLDDELCCRLLCQPNVTGVR